ncbi:hypothetical protein DWB85_09370 [Seongchinamella sediminis]|uniref:Glycosyltransferase RgtA/B/C/D-like domain-containing protein n=1 Tax=Seongchinamella sediminis TaxID=2283635 RepID=A0A3L7E1D0_9GAMM|nr:hypothetical protein [Seongchinamella sediminis]RLQ22133.1 hypothetical protein DWB85_09370 [Seongchinamella sediminis]
MQANPAANALPQLHYLWVFAASLLLSGWLIWLDPLINRDAIIYLRSADAYLADGLRAAQQLHGRPVLALLMAWLHQLSGLSVLHSGLLITTVAYAFLCTGFVACVRILGGNRTVQIIAAVVVLSHPMLNHLRSSIMRDPAYWALVILAFRELLLYSRQPGLAAGLRWFLYILLASLFRFEGVFFALFAPLCLLFCRNLEQRLKHCLLLLAPSLLTLGLALAALLAYHGQQPASEPLFPALHYYLQGMLGFPAAFGALAAEVADPLLRFTSRDDAAWAVVASLAIVLLLNLCRAVTWPWLLTLLAGARAGLLRHLRRDDITLLHGHLLIACAYLAAFMLINRFMLERYSMQVVIFLLLYLPFILGALWHGGGWKKLLAVLLLAGMTADTLHNGDYEKAFIADATRWVTENTDRDASVVSNEKYIAYFSEREFDWAAIQGRRFALGQILETPRLWRDRDYLVIYLKPRQEQRWALFLAEHSLQEMESFGGGRKGRVAVVAIPPASGNTSGFEGPWQP